MLFHIVKFSKHFCYCGNQQNSEGNLLVTGQVNAEERSCLF